MKSRILKDLLIILQSFSLLFQNVRVLELYFLQKPSRAMSEWLGDKSKRMG
jgi:hypothetical protein